MINRPSIRVDYQVKDKYFIENVYTEDIYLYVFL